MSSNNSNLLPVTQNGTSQGGFIGSGWFWVVVIIVVVIIILLVLFFIYLAKSKKEELSPSMVPPGTQYPQAPQGYPQATQAPQAAPRSSYQGYPATQGPAGYKPLPTGQYGYTRD